MTTSEAFGAVLAAIIVIALEALTDQRFVFIHGDGLNYFTVVKETGA